MPEGIRSFITRKVALGMKLQGCGRNVKLSDRGIVVGVATTVRKWCLASACRWWLSRPFRPPRRRLPCPRPVAWAQGCRPFRPPRGAVSARSSQSETSDRRQRERPRVPLHPASSCFTGAVSWRGARRGRGGSAALRAWGASPSSVERQGAGARWGTAAMPTAR